MGFFLAVFLDGEDDVKFISRGCRSSIAGSRRAKIGHWHGCVFLWVVRSDLIMFWSDSIVTDQVGLVSLH